jgi:hypothetical protein
MGESDSESDSLESSLADPFRWWRAIMGARAGGVRACGTDTTNARGLQAKAEAFRPATGVVRHLKRVLGNTSKNHTNTVID